MDNIVDYLVVLFFIVSFLSSIFKKKKAKANTEVDTQKQTIEKPTAIEKKSTGNIFDSFIKSVNDELEKAKQETARSEVDEYYEQAMRKSVENEVSINNSYRQSEYIEPLMAKKKKSEKEKIAIKSYSDSLKLMKEKHESKKAKEIRNSLRQSNSIKNFIIVNEILGKPKALQR